MLSSSRGLHLAVVICEFVLRCLLAGEAPTCFCEFATTGHSQQELRRTPRPRRGASKSCSSPYRELINCIKREDEGDVQDPIVELTGLSRQQLLPQLDLKIAKLFGASVSST